MLHFDLVPQIHSKIFFFFHSSSVFVLSNCFVYSCDLGINMPGLFPQTYDGLTPWSLSSQLLQQNSICRRSFQMRWCWRSSRTCWSRTCAVQLVCASALVSWPTTPSSGEACCPINVTCMLVFNPPYSKIVKQLSKPWGLSTLPVCGSVAGMHNLTSHCCWILCFTWLKLSLRGHYIFLSNFIFHLSSFISNFQLLSLIPLNATMITIIKHLFKCVWKGETYRYLICL